MNRPSIIRKSLLYRSKVEYGGWTVNHVLGCTHGCRYPCYAMMLARRTGRVKDYEDWVQPKVVSNALELLDMELKKNIGQIDMVHLCFTTDPFMYDRIGQRSVQGVVKMSIDIIRKLNSEGIPVTTLTKGIYPEELVEAIDEFHPENQYGISVVSLNRLFREQWEPGAASAFRRIESLKRLSAVGARTWASAEPYPTPNVDGTAAEINTLLNAIGFVDKIVFGKWNYNSQITQFDKKNTFYSRVARQVVDWCAEKEKVLHIKNGTPFSDMSSKAFLGHEAALKR